MVLASSGRISSVVIVALGLGCEPGRDWCVACCFGFGCELIEGQVVIARILYAVQVFRP